MNDIRKLFSTTPGAACSTGQGKESMNAHTRTGRLWPVLMLALAISAPAPAATNLIGGADGSFESGSGGTTISGHVGLVPGIGILRAPQGNQAMLLTTEPDEGSAPSDADISTLAIENFVVPAEYATLRLNYNFLTKEPSPSYTNDAFTAKLILVTAGGEKALLTADTFDDFQPAPLTGYQLQSGFRSMLADVSLFAGSGDLVTLELRIEDVGDGRSDSAVLLDDVRLVEPGFPVAQSNIDYIEIDPGDTVLFDGTASSDDVGITRYDWDFNNGTGGFGGLVIAQYPDAGVFQGTLMVTDGDGNTDTDYFVVLVGDVNSAPAFVSAPVTSARSGLRYRYQAVVDDAQVPFGDVLAYSVVDGPDGLSIDHRSGLVSWIPDAGSPDDNPVTIRVEDSQGLADEQDFSISLDTSSFVIATDDSGYHYYVRSAGDGIWSEFTRLNQLGGLIRGGGIIADYDNDGDWDYVVGSPSGQTATYYYFENDGLDGFSNRGAVGTGGNTNSYSMDSAQGDFNNDGNMDFIGNTNSRYIHVALGDGRGGFQITTVDVVHGNGRGMDSADFNHDGFLDIARTTYSSGHVRLFEGDGTGAFVDRGVIGDPGSDPYGLAAGDFNNDGHPDIIANAGGNGDTYFYAGNGDGSFQDATYNSTLDHGNHGAFDAYDWNGDGNLDFVASSYTTRQIYAYLGNGDGSFGSRLTISTSNTSSNVLGIGAPPALPPLGDPIARITPDFVVDDPGAIISMSGADSSDDGSIVAYEWDFGDGETDSGMNVQHGYPAVEGEYSVKLRVTDDSDRKAYGLALVRLVGDPPVANAGGPYVFGESFATGGIYTVPLDGTGSSDDGPAPLVYEWNMGNGLQGPFSGDTLSPGVWAQAGAELNGSGSAVVSGTGSWGNSYLVTQASYPRVTGDSYRGRLRVPGGSGNRYVMWGLKNTGSNYSYTQFYYAIYFSNNSLFVYESGSSRGVLGSYSPDTTYDVRVDVKALGALYYVRETGTSTWTLLYDSSHSGSSPFRVGATVHSGDIELSHFETPDTRSSAGQPTVTYYESGQYDINLRVTDGVDQQDTDTTTVSLIAGTPPVADPGGPYLLTEASASCGQWTVALDGTGSSDNAGIYSYAWDFGDGNSATGANPTHTYATAGTYTVSLTVTDNALQTHTATTTVSTSAQALPSAVPGGPYSVDESAASSGGWAASVNGAASSDDSGICDYVWDFGDGNTADGSAQTHTYNAAGTYTVTLTVRDNALQSHSATTTYTVTANDLPIADPAGPYSVDENQAQNGQWTAVFDGTGSTDDFGIWSYGWDFGDGNSGTGATPTHVYSAPGTYTVALTVTDNGRQVNTAQTQITVSGNGVPVAEAGPDQLTEVGMPVTLDASASTDDFGIFSYRWDFDSTSIADSNRAVAMVEYDSAGVYQPAVTVTDHAQQSDTDATTITVVLGDPPKADTGGPYVTRTDFPTRFNGRSSSDDFGIEWYTWDFGDGESITSHNPWIDHRYTATGSYTVTLTVTDFAGQSASDASTVNVSKKPLVSAIPWAFSGGIEVPHDSWSGRETTLKAVAWSGTAPMTYSWDFGDGSAPVSGTVTDPNAIEAKHTYTGIDGQPFVATITLTDALGTQASDEYKIRLRAKSLDIEINTAIDEGLWWLHKNQIRGEFTAGTYGSARIDHSHWDQGGGWPGGSGATRYVVSPTSSAVQAFEINAHLELGDVVENPYVETVSRGLRYLPHALRTIAIGPQTYGDPDTNDNGLGVETRLSYDFRHPYEVGQAMDALVSSASKDTYSITGQPGIVDRSYYDLVVDMADVYAWGQSESSAGGGWIYSWNSGTFTDNSAAQWGAIGMVAAENVWGIEIPQWVKERNDLSMTNSYNGTGFGYRGQGNGRNTTPSGLVLLAFDDVVGYDDPATSEDERDKRWQTAESYIDANWNTPSWWYNSSNGSYSYYAYYAFAKAMRLANPQPVVKLKDSGLDWFKDDTNGIARRLINRQQSDGGWPRDGNPGGTYVGYDLTSAWSVIMLTPTLFVQPPVADAGPDRVWGVDVELTLDGSGSFHLDPFRDIVLYEWDLDGDGTFDVSSTEPTTTVTYSRIDYPETALPQNVTVTLRVTDNNAPSSADTDSAVITIAVPPHPPVAEAGGSYSCTAGIACQLDGSESFDIDPTDFITVWQWDTDNDGAFDDVTGSQPFVTFPSVGLFNIGLQVFDNAVLNDANGNGVQDPEERLDDFDFTTVSVVSNLAPAADADGPYTVSEGSTINLDASGSSDPNDNPLAYEWDYDDDGNFDDATGVMPEFTGIDDATVPVAVRVTDGLLNNVTGSTVLVENVAPSVNAGNDQTSLEGATVSFSGNFDDPGVLDTHTITWDFGDGTALVTGTLDPDHVYLDNGTFVVTLTVVDDDGGVGSDTAVVIADNAQPVVEAGADQSNVNLGTPVSLDPATFTDAGVTDVHTAVIDWGDGNDEPGALTQGAGNGSVDGGHSYAVAGNYIVTVTVTDNAGASGFDSFAVEILATPNTPPTVNAGPDAAIDEGDTFVSTGSFTDPDADSWAATVDYGDGTGLQTLSLNPDGTFAPSHLYPDNGIYTVIVSIDDGAGGIGLDNAIVTVNNLAPVVEAGADQLNVPLGTPIVLDPASFTDAGVLDTHTAVIDWGDGNVEPGTLTQGAGSGSVDGGHSFGAAGSYIVTVTITDDDGAIGSDSFTVEVDATHQPPEQSIFDLFARAKSGKIDLVWTPVSGVGSYSVYRSTSQGGPYTAIATDHECDYCAYADFGLVNDTTYYYVVTSVEGGVESLISNEASATPQERRRRR
ncbi:MAG: PKD domain-containing protein [Gammaproteobacteria bacterium]|nr:PKD domain-containing protein [Gammaproteobacteria bacterium]